MCIFNMTTKNILLKKNDNIFTHRYMYVEYRESGIFSELAVIGAFCRYAIAEKRMRQHIFFSSFFNFLNVYLLFKSRIFMIEPI